MIQSLHAEPGTRVDQASVDAAARRLLSVACAPLTFDRVQLLAAVAAFPVRGAGQDQLVGTWGRVPKLVSLPDGRLVRSHDIEGGTGLGTREGRSFRITLGPGVAVCASFDATRRDRAYERDELALRRNADLRGAWLNADPDYVEPAPTREITMWSRKSRARMVKGFASVDWSGLRRCYCGERMTSLAHSFVAAQRCSINLALPLGMLTLTYPGDWLAVAPDGATSKRHLAAFRLRWLRAVGYRLDGAWKLEFQRPREAGNSEGQEAPHYHLLAPIPAMVDGVRFQLWLSRTWADIVGATGQERVNHLKAGTGVDFNQTAKMSDPKRLAVYFLKHGTKSFDGKEYQHTVPEAWQAPGKGPGRFWGFWGMPKATVELELDMADWITARRVLRRVAAARARAVKYSRAYGAAVSAGRGSAESIRAGMASAANEKVPHRILSTAAGWAPVDRGGKKLRTLGVGGQLSGGWVVVNNGPALAGALARAVNLRRLVEVDWGNGDF